MNVSLSPSSLKFSNANLEREYVAYSARKDHRPHELMFVYLDAIMLIIVPFTGRVPFSWWFYFHAVMALSIQFATLKWLEDETWVWYRFPIHFLLRTYRTWIAIKYCLHEEPKMTEGFAHLFITRSGVLINLWYALGMKTVVWQFVILQGFTACYLVMSTSHSACDAILAYPGASEQILRIWKIVSRLLPGNPKDMNCPDAQCFETERLQMCSSLVILTNVHFGFAYMTFLYWLLEVRSRHKYVEELNQSRNRLEIILNTFMNPEIIANLGNLDTEDKVLTFFAVVGFLTVQLSWAVFFET